MPTSQKARTNIVIERGHNRQRKDIRVCANTKTVEICITNYPGQTMKTLFDVEKSKEFIIAFMRALDYIELTNHANKVQDLFTSPS